MPPLTFGSATIAGRSGRNTDAVFASLADDTQAAAGIFVLADAVGADQAAALVANTIAEYLRGLAISNANTALQALNTAYEKAAQALHNDNRAGAASATTLLISGDTAYIAHVGNTRAYAVTARRLDQLTTDHTIEERSLELGLGFSGDEFAPVLVRAVGESDEAPDTLVQPFMPGTALLLLSDGVYRAGAQLMEFDMAEKVLLPLSNEDILKYITTAAGAQAACDALVADASLRSKADSMTAILVGSGFGFAQAEQKKD